MADGDGSAAGCPLEEGERTLPDVRFRPAAEVGIGIHPAKDFVALVPGGFIGEMAMRFLRQLNVIVACLIVAGGAVSPAPATAQTRQQTAANEAPPQPWSMAALVFAHLEATRDYKDLSALYKKWVAADANWARSGEGRAVDAQLENWRRDAAAPVIVEAKGVRVLRYSVGGRIVTDEGIRAADLEKSPAYRETMADGIARKIITSPRDPRAMVALAMFRNGSAPPATATEFVTAAPATGEFYFIDQTGDGQVVLIDPGTISTANGRRTAHVAFVDAMTLWNDVEFEFDCADRRFKKLSVVSHPMMVRSEGGEWQNARNSIELKMTDAVCRWPEKVTKSIVSAPDFQTLIRRASGIVDQQQREKKR